MKTNPGLLSRFAEKVFFNPISPEVSCGLLLGLLKRKEVVIDDISQIQTDIIGIFDDLITKTTGWGNGRDINTIVEQIMRSIAKSHMNSSIVPGQYIVFSHENLLSFMKDFYSKRAPKSSKSSNQSEIKEDIIFATNEPLEGKKIEMKTASKIEELSDSESGSDGDDATLKDENRDDGVSDESWNHLQDSKRKAIQISIDALETARKNQVAIDSANARLKKEKEKLDLELKQANDAEKAAKMKYFERQEKVMKEMIACKQKIHDEFERAEKERKDAEEAVMKKLEHSGRCPAGYAWVCIGEGAYQCTAGGHVVYDAESL